MHNQKTNRLLLTAAMAIFGTLAPFVRNIPISSGQLALCRAVMAAIIIGGYFLIRGKRLNFQDAKKDILPLVLSGFAMGINWILLFEAYKYTTVSVATLSYYFAPVIVIILCPLLFKEKLTKKQILCFIMSTVGLFFVINITGLSGGKDLVGILFGLGAAVFYATVILLNKSIKGIAGIERTFLQFIAAIIILVPYVLLRGGISFGGMGTKGWICLAVVGVIHTGAAYCMYFTGLKNIPGQAAAILSYVDPLVAVIISVAVLKEALTVPQIIGGILILGFTLLNEIELPRKKTGN